MRINNIYSQTNINQRLAQNNISFEGIVPEFPFRKAPRFDKAVLISMDKEIERYKALQPFISKLKERLAYGCGTAFSIAFCPSGGVILADALYSLSPAKGLFGAFITLMGIVPLSLARKAAKEQTTALMKNVRLRNWDEETKLKLIKKYLLSEEMLPFLIGNKSLREIAKCNRF